MRYTVHLTNGATQDIRDIHNYIATHDSKSKAKRIIRSIDSECRRLEETPNRGSRPKEFLALGVHQFRQIFFKSYRIIYHVSGDNVYIVLIADGRRDMQSLLQQRLLS